jgi:hypothetical protein
MSKTIFILILCLVCQISVMISAAVPAKERAALIAFYNSTGGDTWSDNHGWKDEPLEADGFGAIGSEGTWNGIVVSGDHVIEIVFPWYTYPKGTLPPELGDLVYLERLDIEGYSGIWTTYLNGKLPPEMGNLKRLRYLKLRYHGFAGGIPETFGEMSQLEELYLDHNYLTGSLPAELGKLKKLRIFYFSSNLNPGPIPPEWGDMANLEILDLYFNRFSGVIPGALGKLTKLQKLNLDLNLFSGDIPPELGNLTNLAHLGAGSNLLTGTIPPELGKLTELISLNLQGNHLSGNLPPQLGLLSRLKFLYVADNQLVGEIPSTFIHLTNLSVFEVDDNGLFTNDDALRVFLLGINKDWEKKQTVAPKDVSAQGIAPSAIRISWTPIEYVGNIGGYRVYYREAPGKSWTLAGMTADKSTSSYTVSGLLPGRTYSFVVKAQTGLESATYNTVISLSSKEVSASTLFIKPGADQYPFGTMELPREDWEVKTGSMAMGGWALDDVEVAGVYIYFIKENKKTFVGKAVFVEGARPDVELAYPGYPYNRRAGWGYTLLTNVLPGGDGSFALEAVAVDQQGHETSLGTKIIRCENDHAIDPFGSLDTPTPGGTASGSAFVNFGWALAAASVGTIIPKDGSTLGVWVDGACIGHPVYNRYREDIASLFPGYQNSDGAGGYFYLDTTAYENGLHTIAWSVADDAGHTDGIGSRYFWIQNPGREQQASLSRQKATGNRETVLGDILKIPTDYTGSVGILRGYQADLEPEEIYPDEYEARKIKIRQQERLTVYLSDEAAAVAQWSGDGEIPGCQWSGYQVVGTQLRPLPVGSFLDTGRGIFYWQPGAAFAGNYLLIFIETDQYGNKLRKNISVAIDAEFSSRYTIKKVKRAVNQTGYHR